MPTNMQQFTAEGTLLQYTVRCFGNLRQDDRAKKDNNERLVAKKRLIDPEFLKDISVFQGIVSATLRNRAFNFPLKGVYFVPNGLIKTIHERLGEIEEEYNERVEEFLDKYETEVLPEARQSLGEYFTASDYPTRIEMRTKFGFRWQFMSLGPPDSLRQQYPELYEENEQRLREMMSSFEDEATQALRSGFAALVERLTHATSSANGSGKRPRITDSLFNDWRQFIQDFRHMNITNDTDLAEMLQKAQDVMDNVDANRLRGSSNLRRRVHAAMDVINRDVQDRLITGSRKVHLDLED